MAGRKSAGEVQGQVEGAVAVKEKPLRPSQCRDFMRRKLAEEFPQIVQGFVDSAKAGSCQHVKLATELMEPRKRVSRTRPRGAGTVQRLLDKLERERLAKEGSPQQG